MKTKFESTISAARHSFGGAVCAGTILLIVSGAQAQNLFVSQGANIYEFTPNGTRSTFASGLNYPSALAFNSAGDLFEGDAHSGNIYKFTPNGTQSTFASGLLDPVGLAFDSAGDLFEADWGSGHIYAFTPNGTQSTFASGLNYPVGLAFNSAGNLFEADSGSGHVYDYTPNGVQSTFATGLGAANSLAFQGVTLPVPEPSALGLLAVGATALLIRRGCCCSKATLC